MRHQFGGVVKTKNEFNSLEPIHCRAARVIYNLPRDMPSEDVRKTPKGQKSLTPSETWTSMKSHRKWAVPKLTGISPFIDLIHIFYLYIFHFLLTTFSFNNFDFLFVFLFSLFD